MAIKTHVQTITGASGGGGGSTTDEITNDSTVTGATATDALDNLKTDVDGNTTAIGALGSDDISNDSGVTGADVSSALDQLDTDIGALGSDDITNDSGVSGTTVSDALDNLSGGGGGAIVTVWKESDGSRYGTPTGKTLQTTAVPKSTSNVLYFSCTFAIYGTDGDECVVYFKDGLFVIKSFTVVANGTIQYVTLTCYQSISNTILRTLEFGVTSADGSIVLNPRSTDLAGAENTRTDLTVMEMTVS